MGTIGATLLPQSGHAPPPAWLQRLDPRIRILVMLLFAVVVVTLHSLSGLLAALGIALILALAARLPLRPTLRRLAALEGFMLVVLLLLPWTVAGTAVFTLGHWSASIEGITQALRILLKANAILLALLVLIVTLDAVAIGHALARLRVPVALVQLLLMTIRYINVIAAEFVRLRTAMQVRGFRASLSWHTYESLGYFIGMLLLRSLDRSERIRDAMRCRGFNGHFPLFDDLACRGHDWSFAILMVGVSLTLIALDGWHVASL
ncbi:cobalt ECF transporter T component CbiQ [Thiocapsa imhoffii]|uniref:Cobalt ECF transporter T component CbiQ n=1 Tax=Thiocapsa imhoffii TaxID=382777 RepID=A0A9X0WGN1_9GAMM|nr:cobalt ECF transporter T component CbiQ [Thiocapsa imhoffii]MBK1643959.1 cobalt ECF transporter T component CbiQ [Thiocapsa imhoffii]